MWPICYPKAQTQYLKVTTAHFSPHQSLAGSKQVQFGLYKEDVAVNQLNRKRNRQPIKVRGNEPIYVVLQELFNFSVKDSRYYEKSIVLRESQKYSAPKLLELDLP